MIIIDDSTREILVQKCIDPEDVKTAVAQAELHRLYFSASDGSRICSLRLENLTYWVSYKPDGADSFMVQNAYFHRMTFEETA